MYHCAGVEMAAPCLRCLLAPFTRFAFTLHLLNLLNLLLVVSSDFSADGNWTGPMWYDTSAGSAALAGGASTMVMACTLRDFLAADTAVATGVAGYTGPPAGGQGHVDFETYTGFTQKTGMVKPTLGADGKPVADCGGRFGNDCLLTSAASFEQWYRSTPGFNKEVPYMITLTWNAGERVYKYESTDFFPLTGDPRGWDDRADKYPHGAPGGGGGGAGAGSTTRNYWFTLECESRFTYQGGENFVFQGDDDLWIFIDNKLALDLGGVHPSVYGRLSLDGKGLTRGVTYPMKLFFAERHTVDSNFKVSTTFKAQPFYFWVPDPWPPCGCDKTSRARTVKCVRSDAAAVAVAESNCDPAKKPTLAEACDPATNPLCAKWVPQPWTGCDCDGRRVRTAICVSQSAPTVPIDDSKCDPATKPALTGTCPAPATCFQWVSGPYAPCDCYGRQTRPVFCAEKRDLATPVADRLCDAASKPGASQPCTSDPVACFQWVPGPWGECPCAKQRTRTLVCQRKVLPPVVVNDAECSELTRPAVTEACVLNDLEYEAKCVPQPTVFPQSDCLGGGAHVTVLVPLNKTKSSAGLGVNPSSSAAADDDGGGAASGGGAATGVHAAGAPLASLYCAFDGHRVEAKLGADGAVVWKDGDAFAPYVCVAPVFQPPASFDGTFFGGAAGTELAWDARLVLFLDGMPHRRTFKFTYRPCCAPPVAVPLWPLIALLPLALATLCCGICVILVHRTQQRALPPLLHAVMPPRPKTPAVKVKTKTVEATVQIPRPKTPAPPPKRQAEKKKWDTVATGQYFRDGAHVETKWGKFGEMGGETIVHEDEEEEDSSGDEKRELAEVVLHGNVKFEIEVPEAPEIQSMQVSSPTDMLAAQNGEEVDYAGGGTCCPPCFPLVVAILSVLCFIGSIVGIVLLSKLIQNRIDEAGPLCFRNNVSDFCTGLATCAACDEVGKASCRWCNDQCQAAPYSSGGISDGCSAVGGSRTCPVEPMSMNSLAAIAFATLLVISVAAFIARLFFYNRRAEPKQHEQCRSSGVTENSSGGAIFEEQVRRGGGGGLELVVSPTHRGREATESFDVEGGDVSGKSLPSGWAAIYDPDSGTHYYYHAESGATSWEQPLD